MEIGVLLRLQLSMYLLVAVGVLMGKRNFIREEQERFLSDLLISVILPCSIVQSFLVEFNTQLLRQFASTLAVATLTAAAQAALGLLVFRPFPPELRKVMRYGLINANTAFMALPIVEGLLGSGGLARAAVYMIPIRITTWTVGLSAFSAQGERGGRLLRRSAAHPCMVALYIGVFLMVTQIQLPGFLRDSLRFSANCMTALSMLLIGAILSRFPLRNSLRPQVFYFCLFRLVVLPGIIFAVCTLLNVESMTRSVCVIMTAMPAASITAVLARQYRADVESAGYLVIVSTLLNTLTLPLWAVLLNRF